MAFKSRSYETALRWQLLEWIKAVERADILVGIPCYNNEDTIAHVVAAAGQGLHRYFGGQRCAILISDGGSLDDTRERAYQAKIPSSVQRRVAIYRGLPGKGTSFRAIFEAAQKLRVKTVVVVDSDLKSITPEWIQLLATPIQERRAGFVAPLYTRHKYDGTITNMIVYPLTRALFGLQVRQPIGGDFAFSADVANLFAQSRVWETDVAHFGIDIWMTLVAICADEKIVQTFLGTKIHAPKDPAADLGPMFCQVVSTLFFVATHSEARVREVGESQPVEVVGHIGKSLPLNSIKVRLGAMDREFLEGFDQFEPMYRRLLERENYRQLKDIAPALERGQTPDFPPSLWARILYDFLFVYRGWTRNRRRLIDIMVPLYFGRVAAYCREVAELSNAQAEEVIERQAQVFEQEKAYYLKKLTAGF